MFLMLVSETDDEKKNTMAWSKPLNNLKWGLQNQVRRIILKIMVILLYKLSDVSYLLQGFFFLENVKHIFVVNLLILCAWAITFS